MKTPRIADALLSLLYLAAMVALVIIQFQWTPGDAPTIRNGRIAYGYHVAGTDHCAGGAADGTKAALEGCDDNNSTNGDGCSSVCMVESGWSCSGAPSSCSTSCGDGIKMGSEKCDDGNTTNGDGCNSSCAVESGYTCTGQGSGSCTATCGDSVVKTSEACDDGNTTNGDGCSSSCAVESGYTCTGEPSTCVNRGIGGGGGGGGGGEKLPEQSIKPPTPPPPCGNAILEPEKCEECDNGRANGTSACTKECRLLYCGDGITSTYLKEECEGRIEEERTEDPLTKTTMSRFWFVTASCGTSCTMPLWTQKKNGTWEYTTGTGCKRDLNLPPCRGTPTERRVQVRPPFSCAAPSGPANSPAPVVPPPPLHCGDGALQTQEGEECDRVLYDKVAVQRIGKTLYGCSSVCKIIYCGDGAITPFAPLNEECDPKHSTYQSRTCTSNDVAMGCTQECRLSPLPLCPASPVPPENIQPLQELEELLQSLETGEGREEELEEEEFEDEEEIIAAEAEEERKEEEIGEEEEAIVAEAEEGEEEIEEEAVVPPSHAAAPETGRRIGLFIILLAMGFATVHWNWRRSLRRHDR